MWLVACLATFAVPRLDSAEPFQPAPPRESAVSPAAEVPAVRGSLAHIASRFDRYDVVAVPDRDEPEWWAGAPSVVRAADGTFWMAARMRTADAPLGERGYEIRIFRSADGVRFERAASLTREAVGLPGFERPALIIDPASGQFRLYACGRLRGPWCIFRFDDAQRPDLIDPATARPVIEPLAADRRPPAEIVGLYERPAPLPEGYKDPVVAHVEGMYHCWVIGVLNRTERTYHFTSVDGDRWQAVGGPARPAMDLAGWHNYAVRPASLLPLGAGYLLVYEGSDTRWADPVYNIATGLAFTFDLVQLVDLTPDSPLLVSTTPGRLHTWRYSHWMWVDDELWVYAEVEKPNGAHEIRLFRLPRT